MSQYNDLLNKLKTLVHAIEVQDLLVDIDNLSAEFNTEFAKVLDLPATQQQTLVVALQQIITTKYQNSSIYWNNIDPTPWYTLDDISKCVAQLAINHKLERIGDAGAKILHAIEQVLQLKKAEDFAALNYKYATNHGVHFGDGVEYIKRVQAQIAGLAKLMGLAKGDQQVALRDALRLKDTERRKAAILELYSYEAVDKHVKIDENEYALLEPFLVRLRPQFTDQYDTDLIFNALSSERNRLNDHLQKVIAAFLAQYNGIVVEMNKAILDGEEDPFFDNSQIDKSFDLANASIGVKFEVFETTYAKIVNLRFAKDNKEREFHADAKEAAELIHKYKTLFASLKSARANLPDTKDKIVFDDLFGEILTTDAMNNAFKALAEWKQFNVDSLLEQIRLWNKELAAAPAVPAVPAVPDPVQAAAPGLVAQAPAPADTFDDFKGERGNEEDPIFTSMETEQGTTATIPKYVPVAIAGTGGETQEEEEEQEKEGAEEGAVQVAKSTDDETEGEQSTPDKIEDEHFRELEQTDPNETEGAPQSVSTEEADTTTNDNPLESYELELIAKFLEFFAYSDIAFGTGAEGFQHQGMLGELANQRKALDQAIQKYEIKLSEFEIHDAEEQRILTFTTLSAELSSVYVSNISKKLFSEVIREYGARSLSEMADAVEHHKGLARSADAGNRLGGVFGLMSNDFETAKSKFFMQLARDLNDPEIEDLDLVIGDAPPVKENPLYLQQLLNKIFGQGYYTRNCSDMSIATLTPQKFYAILMDYYYHNHNMHALNILDSTAQDSPLRKAMFNAMADLPFTPEVIGDLALLTLKFKELVGTKV